MQKYKVFNEKDVLPKKGENLFDSIILFKHKLLIHPFYSYIFFFIFIFFCLAVPFMMIGSTFEFILYVALWGLFLLIVFGFTSLGKLLFKQKDLTWDSVNNYFIENDEKLLVVLESCNVKYYNVLSTYSVRSVLITDKYLYLTYNKLTKILPQILSLPSSKRKIPYLDKNLDFGDIYIDSKEWRTKFYTNHTEEIKQIMNQNEKET